MNAKKIGGVLIIILAAILTLAIVGQLPQLFKSIAGFLMIFTGKLNASEAGEASGHFIYWVFHFVITIALWKYGLRMLRKQPKV
jgi:hypothetical protein